MGQCCSGPAPATSSSTALFFPDAKMPCRNYLQGTVCRRKNCAYAHTRTSLVALLHVLRSAKKSLCVCVYTITCNEIAEELVRAKQRGVQVCVITDDELVDALGSDIRMLKQAKIPVKIDKGRKAYMHHKFCIVDGNILLNGSFNWTRNGVLGNNENIVITRDAKLCQTFQAEYNRMWKEFVSL